MAEEKTFRELLSEGSHALCNLAMDGGRMHTAKRLPLGLDKLCDHIKELEERIKALEKDK